MHSNSQDTNVNCREKCTEKVSLADTAAGVSGVGNLNTGHNFTSNGRDICDERSKDDLAMLSPAAVPPAADVRTLGTGKTGM